MHCIIHLIDCLFKGLCLKSLIHLFNLGTGCPDYSIKPSNKTTQWIKTKTNEIAVNKCSESSLPHYVSLCYDQIQTSLHL